ncbi:hypothetical protein G9A89_005957 [Geosiphon pyriformis]|nr:hypothetical protein G9A89_005957 [Geosiphon pyriformis]
MEITASSITSKKKTSKSTFHDSADISLSKFGSSNSVYSDVKSLSGEDKDVSMSGANSGSLLGSAATTSKANQWFWGGPSKFKKIIQSTFTSEKSMIKTVSLAKEIGIVINSDLKKQEMRSDRTVIIKEIPMNTPKNMIITAVSEFGEIKSIKIQLIGMWQKTVVEFAEINQADLLASK